MNGYPALKPHQLGQVLRASAVVSEGQRTCVEIGFVELCCARAALILHDRNRNVAMLTLHVDDGTLTGERDNGFYQNAWMAISNMCNIKEWHHLMEGTAN